MEDFLKSVWNEAFAGCTPLMIVKRIIAFIVITIVLIAFCGADSLGGFWVAFVLAMAVFVWKFFNLSSAFPEKDNDDDGWDK